MTTRPPSTVESTVFRFAGEIGVALLILAIMFDTQFNRIVTEIEPTATIFSQRYALEWGTDLMLVIAGSMGLPHVYRRLRSLSWSAPAGLVGSVVFAALTTLAFIVNPSLAGAMFWLRVVFGAGVIAVVLNFTAESYERFFIWPLAVVVFYEASFGLVQAYVWNTGARFLWQLSDAAASVRPAVLGSTRGPYQLALLLIIGTAVLLGYQDRVSHRWIVLVPSALASLAVASTYGRTGALALMLVGGTYLVGAAVKRKPDLAVRGGIAVAPFTLGIILNPFAWSAALSKTVESGTLNRASSGRLALMETALDMARRQPIFGYGPRRWITGLEVVRPSAESTEVVHNVPLLAGAEMGAAVAVMLLGWYALLFYRSLRTSIGTLAVFFSAIPFLMLDKMTYTEPTSMIVALIWLAALDRDWIERTARPD